MNCGTCKHATGVVTKKQYRTGFVRCYHRKPWEWLAPTHECVFEPSKHEPRAKRSTRRVPAPGAASRAA